ncbi:MAG: type-F conjugative transfer system secretin TraK [Legionella sp.]
MSLCIACLGCTPLVQAQTLLNVEENETIELNLSSTDFNRLFVTGDKITKLRFPEGNLTVENDKDGSIYLDVKENKPFTLFVTTQSGAHFSATIKTGEMTGQTIGLMAAHSKSSTPARVFSAKSHKNNSEQELVALVSSVEKEEQKAGFKSQRPSIKPVLIKSNVTSTLVYTLSDAKKMGQKFEIKNTGRRPVTFDDKWFKDSDTKALLVKERVIYPNETITVVRIEEGVRHG